MSLFFNAHKLPSIDSVIEHSKYFSVPLKIARTPESISLAFSCKGLSFSRAGALLEHGLYTHPSHCVFLSSPFLGWALSSTTVLSKQSWPKESVVLGVCARAVAEGQCLWEKLLDLGQRGSSSSWLPCHMTGLLYLCSLWQKLSLLFLHTF